MTARTTVVNVRSEECDVYIGRAMRGRAGSPFANPFRIGEHGTREEVLALYDKHLEELLKSQPSLVQALQSLKGKRLGCWCTPLSCHGHILARRIDGETASPPPVPTQASLF